MLAFAQQIKLFVRSICLFYCAIVCLVHVVIEDNSAFRNCLRPEINIILCNGLFGLAVRVFETWLGSAREHWKSQAIIKKGGKKSSVQITLGWRFSLFWQFLLADNEASRPLPRHECSSEVRPTARAWPPHLESRQIGAGAGSFLSRSKAEGPDPLNYLLNFQPGLFLLISRGEP